MGIWQRSLCFSPFSSTAPLILAPAHTPNLFKPIISCRLDDAAKQTVDYFVRDGMLLGLGTGSGSSAAISYIGQKLRNGTLRDVVGVPMSGSSAVDAAKAGLPLLSFEDNLKGCEGVEWERGVGHLSIFFSSCFGLFFTTNCRGVYTNKPSQRVGVFEGRMELAIDRGRKLKVA